MIRWNTAITFTSSPASHEHYTSESPTIWRRESASTAAVYTVASPADYKVDRLVYYEQFQWVQAAIGREKQLKRWRREKKVALIERDNPTWGDLSAEWGKPARLQIHVLAQ